MKRSIPIKLLSCLLTAVMLFTTCSVAATAAANNDKGKYLKDVFIAYGEDKEKAVEWLTNNGWEPFEDFNDGKSSNRKTKAYAVMGIRRTSDPSEAITDMATMYMKGEYSFDDYEDLVKKKKANITEFINTFIPTLKEYRDNYNGKGSEGGQKRAQMAHDMLNKFYDGDPNGEYAVNDTGKPLGDLLLNKTKTEIGDDAYNALSAADKLNTADLQQIILESSGPAVLAVEQALALATDTAEDSWLDRLDGLTGQDLVDRIEEFAPEAAGQDLAPSAAMNLLASHFEDYSKKLAKQWSDIRRDILWFEDYCEENDLWQNGDRDAIDDEKAVQFFTDLEENDKDRYISEFQRFCSIFCYYFKIKDIDYSGDWGNTLYEFFCPEDEEEDYTEEYSYFAPMAAALSDGQRAALSFISLRTLLKIGMSSDAVTEADLPSTDNLFKNNKGEKLDTISIYSGINRAVFRKGVALTNSALEQKNLGKDPYDKFWNEGGIADMIAYTTIFLSGVAVIAGITMVARTHREITQITKRIEDYANEVAFEYNNDRYGIFDQLRDEQRLGELKPVNTAGKWLAGIGAALIALSIALKAVELHLYYHRTFTPIPMMIVDRADIVTEVTDAKGNKDEIIDFKQFAYYEVVKCNRQEVGIHTSAQNGVSDYASWGCGDAADLNADTGLQWLALYVNRSAEKGNPILADTLKLQKGSSETPSGYNGKLHMFGYTNAVKLDNIEYSYRDDNEGMYLFWKSDANALTAAASTFNAGYLALAGIGGIGLGVLGTTLVMLPKLKKRREEEAA